MVLSLLTVGSSQARFVSDCLHQLPNFVLEDGLDNLLSIRCAFGQRFDEMRSLARCHLGGHGRLVRIHNGLNHYRTRMPQSAVQHLAAVSRVLDGEACSAAGARGEVGAIVAAISRLAA